MLLLLLMMLGSGLRLVGGVRCESSEEVHAQIVVYKTGQEERTTNTSLRNGT